MLFLCRPLACCNAALCLDCTCDHPQCGTAPNFSLVDHSHCAVPHTRAGFISITEVTYSWQESPCGGIMGVSSEAGDCLAATMAKQQREGSPETCATNVLHLLLEQNGYGDDKFGLCLGHQGVGPRCSFRYFFPPLSCGVCLNVQRTPSCPALIVDRCGPLYLSW